jgi:hypothetical protein
MNIETVIKKIIEKQERPQSLPGVQFIPVNLRLKNGNILLKEFKIVQCKRDVLIGLTRQEEYAAPREFRSPVYCKFKLEEIESIEWYGIEVEKIKQ